MTPQELSAFEKLGNGNAAFEGVAGSVRQPFCAVVALKDRLSVVGSSELLSQILSKHSPTSILPERWGECSASRAGRLVASYVAAGGVAFDLRTERGRF